MSVLEKIQRLLEVIKVSIESSDNIGSDIARGTGGREVALAKTKLQEAEDWLARAQKEINAKQ